MNLPQYSKHALFKPLRTIISILFLLPICLFSTSPEAPKKKILILSSNGGNGHKSAAKALCDLLGERYEFRIIYPINELKIFGVDSGEELYNIALRNSWIRSVNVVSKYIAPKIFRVYKKKLEEMMAEEIAKDRPDLIISVAPFVNLPTSEAARKQGIPYLIITTDNDLQNFVHGLQGISHPQLKIVIAPYLNLSRTMLLERNISDQNISVLGFPIRSDFLEKKDRNALKSHYRIDSQKPVVLVVIGGAGGNVAFDYAENLGKTQLGIHLIVCAGRNQELAKSLRKIQLHPTNSMTVMGFTDKMADLMTIADLIITKPGTLSTTEALAMHLPVLVDCTSPVIAMEQANIDVILKYGVGTTIQQMKQLEPLVRTYLFDQELRHEIQKSYRKLPDNRFNESIASLVEEMCKS